MNQKLEPMLNRGYFSRHIDKFQDFQVLDRRNWSTIPDIDLTDAARHIIHVWPAGGSTVTEMNTLDPALIDATVDEGRGWHDPPHGYGHVAIHGRAMS